MVFEGILRFFLVTLFVALNVQTGAANPQGQNIAFNQSWKEQGFLRLFSNEYILNDRQLEIVSDGTVSILWRPVPIALSDVEQASWEWTVTSGVYPTDLTQRGGDDRNLALYFVFVDPETANGLNKTSARKLLRNPNAKALIYVWGGNHSRGELLQSPYSNALKSKILRIGQSGSFSESVNIDLDFTKAFGNAPKKLVGLAISADSDDTNGFIRASIRDLRLQ